MNQNKKYIEMNNKKYTCCGNPTASGGHQPHCPLLSNKKYIEEFTDQFFCATNQRNDKRREKIDKILNQVREEKRKKYLEELENMLNNGRPLNLLGDLIKERIEELKDII